MFHFCVRERRLTLHAFTAPKPRRAAVADDLDSLIFAHLLVNRATVFANKFPSESFASAAPHRDPCCFEAPPFYEVSSSSFISASNRRLRGSNSCSAALR